MAARLKLAHRQGLLPIMLPPPPPAPHPLIAPNLPHPPPLLFGTLFGHSAPSGLNSPNTNFFNSGNISCSSGSGSPTVSQI